MQTNDVNQINFTAFSNFCDTRNTKIAVLPLLFLFSYFIVNGAAFYGNPIVFELYQLMLKLIS